jgi:hypothetical protein
MNSHPPVSATSVPKSIGPVFLRIVVYLPLPTPSVRECAKHGKPHNCEDQPKIPRDTHRLLLSFHLSSTLWESGSGHGVVGCAHNLLLRLTSTKGALIVRCAVVWTESLATPDDQSQNLPMPSFRTLAPDETVPARYSASVVQAMPTSH